MLPSCASDFITQILSPENKAEMCQQATSGVDKSLFFLRFGLSVSYIFLFTQMSMFPNPVWFIDEASPKTNHEYWDSHVSAFIRNILDNPAYSIVFRSATPAYARAQINKSAIKLLFCPVKSTFPPTFPGFFFFAWVKKANHPKWSVQSVWFVFPPPPQSSQENSFQSGWWHTAEC